VVVAGSMFSSDEKNQRLLSPAPIARCRLRREREAGAGSKSFLVLFFKKDVLPSLCC
jgi:hypothetical protein